MLTIVSGVASLLVTLIGAGKGFLELHQLFTAVSKPADGRILVGHDKEGKEFAPIYASLELSGVYVGRILQRLQMQFIVVTAFLLVIWGVIVTLVLLSGPIVSLFLGAGIVLLGIALCGILAMWPQRVARVIAIGQELVAAYQEVDIQGQGRDGAITFVGIGATAAELEKRLSNATKQLVTAASRYQPLLAFFQLRAGALTTSERDLLDSHIQLSSLVTSIEAQMIKRKVEEARVTITELSQEHLLRMVTDAIVRLAKERHLEARPPNIDEQTSWATKQKTQIIKEFQNLGLQPWIALLDETPAFYSEVTLAALASDRSKVQAIVAQYLRIERPRSSWVSRFTS